MEKGLGKAILYADKMTGSMERAIAETDRRRERQVEYNEKHGITPASIKKNISDLLNSVFEKSDRVQVSRGFGDSGDQEYASPEALQKQIKALEKQMRDAAADLEFETAARLRDEVRKLEAMDLGLTGTSTSPRLAKGWSQTSNVKTKGRKKK